MLRAVVLLSFLRRLHRFSTASRPAAKAGITSQMPATWSPACKQAKPLPGLDFHRLADDSFQDTPAWVGRRLTSIIAYRLRRNNTNPSKIIVANCHTHPRLPGPPGPVRASLRWMRSKRYFLLSVSISSSVILRGFSPAT